MMRILTGHSEDARAYDGVSYILPINDVERLEAERPPDRDAAHNSATQHECDDPRGALLEVVVPNVVEGHELIPTRPEPGSHTPVLHAGAGRLLWRSGLCQAARLIQVRQGRGG